MGSAEYNKAYANLLEDLRPVLQKYSIHRDGLMRKFKNYSDEALDIILKICIQLRNLVAFEDFFMLKGNKSYGYNKVHLEKYIEIADRRSSKNMSIGEHTIRREKNKYMYNILTLLEKDYNNILSSYGVESLQRVNLNRYQQFLEEVAEYLVKYPKDNQDNQNVQKKWMAVYKMYHLNKNNPDLKNGYIHGIKTIESFYKKKTEGEK